MALTKERFLQIITNHYLKSGDFNGYPTRKFVKGRKAKKNLKKILKELINDELMSLNFGDYHPNPHIKALPPHPIEVQIKKIKRCNFTHVCAYPEKKYLQTVVKEEDYYDKPFTKKLALGDAQLTYYSFDLSVLEFYRNDPRYYYQTDDISGFISITDDYYESDKI